MSRFRTVGEPGLYVHRDQYESARQIATPPVYIDETLMPGDWYIVAKRPRVPDGPQMTYIPLPERAAASDPPDSGEAVNTK